MRQSISLFALSVASLCLLVTGCGGKGTTSPTVDGEAAGGLDSSSGITGPDGDSTDLPLDGGSSGSGQNASPDAGAVPDATNPITGGACSSNLDCRTSQRKVCNIPTAECVECLTVNDCVSGDGGAAGRDCVKNTCVTYASCTDSGACAPVTCSPGARFCQGSEIRICSAKGDGSTVGATCSASQYCDSTSLTCLPRRCAPGKPVCNGKIATLCNADGSGYASAGTNCAAQGQLCNPASGACQNLVCSPNGYFCEAGISYQCAGDGLSYERDETCYSSQACDANNGRCKELVCAPGAAMCSADGRMATKCLPDGSGAAEDGTDCSKTGQICSDGECKSLVCSPNSSFCEDNAIRKCSSDGLTATTTKTCASGLYCDPTSAGCKPWLCQPNKPACNGPLATTCNSAGSGYTGTNTDCSVLVPTSSCDPRSGTCEAQVCTPKAMYCDSALTKVLQCSVDGLTVSTFSTCNSQEYCDATSTTASCKAKPCAAGRPACDRNVATTCNSTGTGYTGTRTDCTETGRYCDNGVCTANPVDVIGDESVALSAEQVSPYQGNIFVFKEDRRLIRIAHKLGVMSDCNFDFFIYDCGTWSPSIDWSTTECVRIDVDRVRGLKSEDSYLSSGVFDVSLRANHAYAMGVYWMSMYQRCFYDEPSTDADITTTFGEWVAGFNGYILAPSDPMPSRKIFYREYLTTKRRYLQKIETAAPSP